MQTNAELASQPAPSFCLPFHCAFSVGLVRTGLKITPPFHEVALSHTRARALDRGAACFRLLPCTPGVQPLGRLPCSAGLKAGNTPSKRPTAHLLPQGGESAGLARLRHYLWDTDAVAEYFNTRNGMLGAEYSTKFAPWLAAGCLSPRSIYHELQRYEATRTANKSTYWVVFELIWRDFFRCVCPVTAS